MSIDLSKEFQRMSEEFSLTEKEVVSSVRTMIRSMWGESVFKADFLKRHAQIVINDNPRSMKKYPTVTRYRCANCGGLFGSADIELDHIESENTLKSFNDIESFMKTIVLTSPNKLQIMCKDKKRKVKGKSVLVRLGCHGIKTHMERYGFHSFNDALVDKYGIDICKSNEKTLDFVNRYALSSLNQIKTKKAKEEFVKDYLLTNSELASQEVYSVK